MENLTLARLLHIIVVMLWIGGVAMVTTVIIPAAKAIRSPEERITFFRKIESRFSIQAKITTLITGLTGFYMLYEMNAWDRYLDYHFWWLHAMTFVWLLFTVLLYVLEPLILEKLLNKYAIKESQKTFQILHNVHWGLLILSLITIAGAVAGSHGWFIFK
ncbi:MAG: hypothetical protein ACTHY4_03805 [Flavobacteriaceae bacterium]|nr:hypothetical protein [Psychroflexus sp.]